MSTHCGNCKGEVSLSPHWREGSVVMLCGVCVKATKTNKVRDPKISHLEAWKAKTSLSDEDILRRLEEELCRINELLEA